MYTATPLHTLYVWKFSSLHGNSEPERVLVFLPFALPRPKRTTDSVCINLCIMFKMEQAVSTRHGRKQSHNQLAAGPCITRRILLCTPVRPSPVYSTHQHRLQLSHRMHSALMCVPQQNRELHRNTKRNFIFVLCRLMLVESHLAQEDPTKNCSYKFVMRRKLTRCVGMEWNGMAWRGMECVLKLVLPSH